MIIIALAAALMLDSPAKPDPIAKPTAREIAAAQEALPPPLTSVAVTLECTARASGRVENCRVLGETHPGLGFGQAAVALMRDATVEPGAKDFQFARTIQFTP